MKGQGVASEQNQRAPTWTDCKAVAKVRRVEHVFLVTG